MKARREAKKEVNRLREEEAENKRLRRQLKKLEAVKAKLESAGITTSALNLSSQMPSTGKTPVMQVDEDMSPDITLKTPPHVKKIKSRDESISQILFFNIPTLVLTSPSFKRVSTVHTVVLGKTPKMHIRNL